MSKLTAYTMSFLIRNRAGQSQVIRGKTVLQTLENFFSSSDEEICEEHTPIWFINTHGEKKLVSQEEKKVSTHGERRVGLQGVEYFYRGCSHPLALIVHGYSCFSCKK